MRSMHLSLRLLRASALGGVLFGLGSVTLPAVAEPIDFAMLPALESTQPTKATMLDLAHTGERLVAVGEQGLILYSDNQGKSWQQANVPVSVSITSVFFVNAELGWATGHQGVILMTTDGGHSWTRQFSGRDAQQQVLALAKQREKQLNEAIANAQNDDESEDMQYQLDDLQATIDDANKAIAEGPSEPLMDIWFSDEKHGIAVGAYGLLLLTDDGGKQWRLHPDYLQNADKYHFYAIAALDAKTVLVAGEQGVLWRTRDGGATWEALKSPHQGSFFGAMKLKDNSLLIYGLRNHVYRSTDAGDTWQPVVTGSQSSVLGGTTFGDACVLLVTSDGALLISRDNAASFKVKQLDDRSALAAAQVLGDKSVLLAGRNGVHLMSIDN